MKKKEDNRTAEEKAVDSLIGEMRKLRDDRYYGEVNTRNSWLAAIRHFRWHDWLCVILMGGYIVFMILLLVNSENEKIAEVVSWLMLAAGLGLAIIILGKLLLGNSVSREAHKEGVTEDELNGLNRFLFSETMAAFTGNTSGFTAELEYRKSEAERICNYNNDLIIAVITGFVSAFKPVFDIESQTISHNPLIAIISIAVCFTSLLVYLIKGAAYSLYWSVNDEVLLHAMKLLDIRSKGE